jgi:carboxylesterase
MTVPDVAKEYRHDAGDVGVLLCHGFTGSPASMRPWAEHLAAAGYSVEVPLLPGHGTSWAAANDTTWHDWFGAVEAALTGMVARCRAVVVAGLSMGGCLALRLAEVHPAQVAGLLLVNPVVTLADRRLVALPVLRRLTASFPGIANDIARPGQDEIAYDRVPLHALHSQRHLWKAVRDDLPTVTAPLILFRSAVDHVVDPSSAPIILGTVSSPEATEVMLPNSYHVATLDHDAPLIFQRSVEFVAQVTAPTEAVS